MAIPAIPTGGAPQPGGSPASIPHDALVRQKQGQAITIWGIGAFCIFGWELLVCLPKEYRTIWKRQMNLSSVLYLLNRYFGALQLCFVVSLNANAWSSSSCRHVYYFEPVGALISTVLSQMILGSRVYAVYLQNRTIGLILVLTLVAEVVIGGISISTTRTRLPTVLGAPGSVPTCGAITGPFGWLVAFWSIPLFYDTLAFFLTAAKAYDFWRKDLNTHIFEVIWRDGILYFFAIFSMNAVNVIIFGTVPKALQPVNLTPTLVLEIVLSCRLVLNLRGTYYQPTEKSQSHGKTWNDSTKVNSYDPLKDPPSASSNAITSSNGGVHVRTVVRQADSDFHLYGQQRLGGGEGGGQLNWNVSGNGIGIGNVIHLQPLRRAHVRVDDADERLDQEAVWNIA